MRAQLRCRDPAEIPPRSLAEIFAEICALDPHATWRASPSTCHARLTIHVSRGPYFPHVSHGPHLPRVTRTTLSTCHSQLGDILLGADEMARHVADSLSTCHAQLGDILLGSDEMACHVADEERALEEARDAVIALQMVQVPMLPRRLLLLSGVCATGGVGVLCPTGVTRRRRFAWGASGATSRGPRPPRRSLLSSSSVVVVGTPNAAILIPIIPSAGVMAGAHAREAFKCRA